MSNRFLLPSVFTMFLCIPRMTPLSFIIANATAFSLTFGLRAPITCKEVIFGLYPSPNHTQSNNVDTMIFVHHALLQMNQSEADDMEKTEGNY